MALQVQIAVPNSDKKYTVNTGLFINNEFVPSADSQETLKYVTRHRTQWIACSDSRSRAPHSDIPEADSDIAGW